MSGGRQHCIQYRMSEHRHPFVRKCGLSIRELHRTGKPAQSYKLNRQTALEAYTPPCVGRSGKGGKIPPSRVPNHKSFELMQLWHKRTPGDPGRNSGSQLETLPLHRIVLFLLGMILLLPAGCQSTPTVQVDYHRQRGLLQDAIAKLEQSPDDSRDQEALRMLRQLETELADSELRDHEAERRIAELEQEVAELRQAAGFAVDHIDILYFTRLTAEGIDLWVTPFDRHNDVVKTAGSFEISLHRPGVWGLRKLGPKTVAWKFSAQEVETRWEGELFEGYHLKLAWPDGSAPEVAEAMLRVEFTTAEGKTYTATKEMTITREETAE